MDDKPKRTRRKRRGLTRDKMRQQAQDKAREAFSPGRSPKGKEKEENEDDG